MGGSAAKGARPSSCEWFSFRLPRLPCTLSMIFHISAVSRFPITIEEEQTAVRATCALVTSEKCCSGNQIVDSDLRLNDDKMWRVQPRESREGPASCEGGAKPRLEIAGTAVQEINPRKKEKASWIKNRRMKQAQLHLQVTTSEEKPGYARRVIGSPKLHLVNNIDDVMRIAPMGTETGSYVRMVIGYWEQPARCSATDYCTRISSLRPAASSSECGRRLSPSFRRFASVLSTSRSLRTSKRRRSAMRRGRNSATRSHIAAMRQFMHKMRGQAASAAKA